MNKVLTASIAALMLAVPGCNTPAPAHHWGGGGYHGGWGGRGDWGRHRGRMWYGYGRGGYGYGYGGYGGYRRYWHGGRYYWIPLAMLGAAAAGAILWQNYQNAPQGYVQQPDGNYYPPAPVINNYR